MKEASFILLLVFVFIICLIAALWILYKFLHKEFSGKSEESLPFNYDNGYWNNRFAYAADGPLPSSRNYPAVYGLVFQSGHRPLPKDLPKIVVKEAKQKENYVIFTDGSECGNRCGFGVYAGLESSLNRSTVLLRGEKSSSVAELQGIIQPLLELIMEGQSRVNLYIGTDSLFTIIGLQWIQRRRARSLPPNSDSSGKFNQERNLFYYEYYDYLKVLHALASLFGEVYVFHVPAHQSIAQNEMADILAKLSVSKEETLKKALKKVRLINKQQLKTGMDSNVNVKYCKISRGECQPDLQDEKTLAILHQPMEEKYNLKSQVNRKKEQRMTVETAIYNAVGTAKILNTDKLIAKLKQGERFNWEQLLPR